MANMSCTVECQNVNCAWKLLLLKVFLFLFISFRSVLFHLCKQYNFIFYTRLISKRLFQLLLDSRSTSVIDTSASEWKQQSSQDVAMNESQLRCSRNALSLAVCYRFMTITREDCLSFPEQIVSATTLSYRNLYNDINCSVSNGQFGGFKHGIGFAV